jgi:hypothetical protein
MVIDALVALFRPFEKFGLRFKQARDRDRKDRERKVERERMRIEEAASEAIIAAPSGAWLDPADVPLLVTSPTEKAKACFETRARYLGPHAEVIG